MLNKGLFFIFATRVRGMFCKNLLQTGREVLSYSDGLKIADICDIIPAGSYMIADSSHMITDNSNMRYDSSYMIVIGSYMTADTS